MENMVVSKFGDQKHYWWSSVIEASFERGQAIYITSIRTVISILTFKRSCNHAKIKRFNKTTMI